MKKPLVDLMTSKRFLVLVGSLVSVLAVRLGLDVTPEVAQELTVQITTLAATFIGGVSVSDAAKAVTLPMGVGHKDQ